MSMHEVSISCNCADIENCLMERYISDVRIAVAKLERQEDEYRRALSGLLRRISLLER